MRKKRSGWVVDLSDVPRHLDMTELEQVSVPVFDQVTQKRMKMRMGDMFQKFR